MPQFGYDSVMHLDERPIRNAQDLPALGDWDGPIFGELGVLHTDGDKVECHCCGRWYVSLAHHVRPAHQMLPDEYRAIFGLRATTSLDAPSLCERKRQYTAPQLAVNRARMRENVVQAMTTEERRALVLGRKLRLEARLDPTNQQIWERWQQRGTERARELWDHPNYRRQRSQQLSHTRDARIEVTCAVCGAPFTRLRWELKGHQHTCSQDCLWEFQRRRIAAGDLGRAEVRAKAGASRRRSLAARPDYGPRVGAAISAARRRRPELLVEQLKALAPACFDRVPEPAHTLVRRYYGLDGEAAQPKVALMERFHLDHKRLNVLLQQGVATLLGPLVADPHLASATRLTACELEVLTLLAQDRSTHDIATSLATSVNVVRVHLHHIARKLGVPGRGQLVDAARQRGLLGPEAPTAPPATASNGDGAREGAASAGHGQRPPVQP